MQVLWPGFRRAGDFPDQWALAGIGIIVGSGLYVAYGERVHLHRLRV